MQAIKCTRLAFTLGALLAAPAFAAAYQDPAIVRAKTPVITHASDAVSARATTRETGRIKAPTSSPTNVDATGTAYANPGHGSWWADADLNGDGKLSAAEAKGQSGLDARFSTVDADADGYVTNEEYRGFLADSGSQGELHASANPAVLTRDLWMQLDINGDGKLSASEVSANSGISGVFPRMDGNGDGFVTQAEYTAYVKANAKK